MVTAIAVRILYIIETVGDRNRSRQAAQIAGSIAFAGIHMFFRYGNVSVCEIQQDGVGHGIREHTAAEIQQGCLLRASANGIKSQGQHRFLCLDIGHGNDGEFQNTIRRSLVIDHKVAGYKPLLAGYQLQHLRVKQQHEVAGTQPGLCVQPDHRRDLLGGFVVGCGNAHGGCVTHIAFVMLNRDGCGIAGAGDGIQIQIAQLCDGKCDS